MPVQVQGSRIHGSRVVRSPQVPGSPDPRVPGPRSWGPLSIVSQQSLGYCSIALHTPYMECECGLVVSIGKSERASTPHPQLPISKRSGLARYTSWWCDYVYYGLFSEAFAGRYIQVVQPGGEGLGRLGLHLYHLPQVTLRSV